MAGAYRVGAILRLQIPLPHTPVIISTLIPSPVSLLLQGLAGNQGSIAYDLTTPTTIALNQVFLTIFILQFQRMKMVFLLLFLQWSTTNVSAQYANEKSPLVIRLNDSILNTPLCLSCERPAITIKRQYPGQTVILILGSAPNTVWLLMKKSYDAYKEKEKNYDSHQSGLIKTDLRDYYSIRKSEPKGLIESPTLNLTTLDDGDYIVEWTPSHTPGTIKISIATQ